jgi:hypothetical protein
MSTIINLDVLVPPDWIEDMGLERFCTNTS